MEKLQPMELKALSILMKSTKGLDTYSFFRRLESSFSDFSKTLRTLCDKDLVIEKIDDFFVITNEGMTLLSQQHVRKIERPWREVPLKYLGSKISIEDHYIPNIRLLDKTTFN